MSAKEIFGFLSIIPDKSLLKPTDPVQTELQSGNVFFRNVTRRRTISLWDTNNTSSVPQMRVQPWKNAFLLEDGDDTVGHSFFGTAGPITIYPHTPPSPPISAQDYRKFRATGVTTSILSTDIPRVIGAVGALDPLVTDSWMDNNNIISINDVPLEYTQIGIVYQHPTFIGGSDISTTAGASYVTFASSHYLDFTSTETHCANVLRIHSGADAGMYLVRFVDFTNNRLHLINLDGSLFVGQATAGTLPWSIGPGRRAYFNEVSIIQLSTGLVATGGSFRPGAVRNSFILRVIFDKTGSDASAVGTEQQGTYYVAMRPYTHGSGLGPLATISLGIDTGRLVDNMLWMTGGVQPFGTVFWDGGVNGYALDETNQRLWFGYTNGSNQSGIAHWRWKTSEGFREIQNYLNTGAHKTFVTPSLLLGSGDIIRDLRIGPEGIVYVSIAHATAGNGGVAVIKPDLTTLQYNTGSGVPSSDLSGTGLDPSRARVGTVGDVSTNGADQVTSASGGFTDADLFRAIKLTGLGADSGTYQIATRISATQVTVQTLAGGVVTFTTQSGGTFEIGERLYLFFNNGTTGAGKINFMESLAPGTFLTRTVAMTNGANCNVFTHAGETSKVSVDPVTGNVFWLSNDTQQQINKYSVATNAHAFLTVADVQSPAGGTGTLGTITVFTAIHANSKFDEVWVGTTVGEVKVVKSTFAAGTAKRYYGDSNTTYANPAGFLRPAGGFDGIGTNNRVRSFNELPDGRMMVMLADAPNIVVAAYYSREADLWSHKDSFNASNASANCVGSFVFDSIGNFLYVFPAAKTTASGQAEIAIGCVEVQYQWDNANSKWIPLEVYQGALPNKDVADTTYPGCRTKPIHAALEEVLYGVKVGFTKLGGATPPNNEFLGRAGQTTVTKTDGATSIGTATFTGSGFVSGDVGRLLRLETGADAGVYKISVFNSATSIDLTKLNGTAFSAAATAATLNYTVWSLGSPGSNAGPETASVLLADGFGKDNTQDVTGITYDTFHFKTLMEENVEGLKVCVSNPIGVPGGLEMKVYYDFFPYVASPVVASHDLATTQIRALPASEHSVGGFDGRKLVDGFVDGMMNYSTFGVPASNRGLMHSSPGNDNVWYGTLSSDGYGFLNPVNSAIGCCPMVDLGADAEVGFIIVRGRCKSTQSLVYTRVSHGLKANIYKANNAGGTPVASATSRTSGTTDLTLVVNNNTITTTSDFLGSITTGPFSNGSVTAGQNLFNAPAATFVPGDVGKILKITSVGDVGAYRITAVDGTGAVATVRNLNQTVTAWSATVSSVVYEVRDGVREEDVICVPSIAAATQRLCIERLLTPTTAQVRIAPHTSVSSQSWQCAIPTWDPVKRIQYNTEGAPPDVANNGTWVCEDGREQFDYQDWKVYADLTDLSAAARTGRWWQLQMMPRGTNASSGDFFFSTFEFYSPAGVRLGVSQNTFTNNSMQNADFLASHINRLDFIQSRYDAMSGVAGFNGTVNLGGANGDTLTLTTGGNKFLGYQTRRPFTDGVSTAGAGGNFSSATAAFVTSDVGRILRLQTGVDAGYYRIATRVSGTAITVTTPTGGAVTFTGATGSTFSVHEGISVGGVAPDRIVFLDNQTREYTIATINNALDTITILEADQVAMTGKQWEIRRPSFDTASNTVDSTKLARLVRPETTYPLQMGDVAHDSRGALRFFVDDIGTGNSRSDGSITGGNGVFVGSGFCPDDVGRLLYITTGNAANLGIWKISVFTNATTITVVNAYTGAAVVFTADVAADKVYKIYGDRRFKITKQVTALRA